MAKKTPFDLSIKDVGGRTTALVQTAKANALYAADEVRYL